MANKTRLNGMPNALNIENSGSNSELLSIHASALMLPKVKPLFNPMSYDVQIMKNEKVMSKQQDRHGTGENDRHSIRVSDVGSTI
jgi:hypothetical protein